MNIRKKILILIFFWVICIYITSVLIFSVNYWKSLRKESKNSHVLGLNERRRANACIIFMLRNSALQIFLNKISQFEANFNKDYNYPYVLFNDVEFTMEFKNSVAKVTKSKIDFAQIPPNQWRLPEWIDTARKVNNEKIIGFRDNYRHMCRFYSGFFYRHEATLKYEMYWRLDLDSNIPCQLKYDPFQKFVRNEKLLYGFALGSPEPLIVIQTLWQTARKWLYLSDYLMQMPDPNHSAIEYVSNDNGVTLNIEFDVCPCTFYNNFEIARFSLYRNERYTSYFNYLDRAGGFYYERWGDAPVHTFYVLLMLRKDQIHFYDDIPYGHMPKKNYKMVNSSLCVMKLERCGVYWKYLFHLEKSSF